MPVSGVLISLALLPPIALPVLSCQHPSPLSSVERQCQQCSNSSLRLPVPSRPIRRPFIFSRCVVAGRLLLPCSYLLLFSMSPSCSASFAYAQASLHTCCGQHLAGIALCFAEASEAELAACPVRSMLWPDSTVILYPRLQQSCSCVSCRCCQARLSLCVPMPSERTPSHYEVLMMTA